MCYCLVTLYTYLCEAHRNMLVRQQIMMNEARKINILLATVQFSSVAQSGLTLCSPMNRSTPGLPVHHQLPEFTQTHVHRVGDAIQPSHGNPLQYSCLENPMDRGAWRATVHKVTKSWP